MSSSMRNAIQRRPHRERSQPHERRHLGLLEKHKDYSLRAKDYKKKQAHLKNLRLKAQDRNEDEFYFGMHSQKGPGSALVRGKAFTGRIEGDRGNKGMEVDVVRLLKTQDIGYIRTVRNVARKEAEELRRRVVLARQAGGLGMSAETAASNKIVFMDGVEEREQALSGKPDSSSGAGDDDYEDDDFKGFGDEMEEDGPPGDAGKDAERRLALNKLETRLENAEKKLEALDKVERHLEIQQAKMAKTATSGGFTRKGAKLMVRKRKK